MQNQMQQWQMLVSQEIFGLLRDVCVKNSVEAHASSRLRSWAVVTTVVFATVLDIYHRPQTWKQQLIILTLARTLSIHSTKHETSNQHPQNAQDVLRTFVCGPAPARMFIIFATCTEKKKCYCHHWTLIILNFWVQSDFAGQNIVSCWSKRSRS